MSRDIALWKDARALSEDERRLVKRNLVGDSTQTGEVDPVACKRGRRQPRRGYTQCEKVTAKHVPYCTAPVAPSRHCGA